MKVVEIGIYSIENSSTGNCYIGSSNNLLSRRRSHFSCLRHGRHNNLHLQRAWDKYGEDVFTFSILMYCNEAELLEWEQAFIDEWKPEYNLNPIASKPPMPKGGHPSDETRRKMSEAASNSSDEHRRKISEAHIGKSPSVETRKKISDTLTGKKGAPRTEEWNRKNSEANTGSHRSEEARRKMSEAHRGKKTGPLSNERRRKISDALIGHPISEETRHKISETLKGRKRVG